MTFEAAKAKVLESVPDYPFCSDHPVNLFARFRKRG